MVRSPAQNAARCGHRILCPAGKGFTNEPLWSRGRALLLGVGGSKGNYREAALPHASGNVRKKTDGRSSRDALPTFHLVPATRYRRRRRFVRGVHTLRTSTSIASLRKICSSARGKIFKNLFIARGRRQTCATPRSHLASAQNALVGHSLNSPPYVPPCATR
jgi:hypothetical protein